MYSNKNKNMAKYDMKSLNSYPSFHPERYICQIIKLRELLSFKLSKF